MKRKIIFYTIILTALLFSGCTGQSNQRPENSPGPGTSVHESSVNQSSVNQSSMNQSSMNQSSVNESSANQSSANQSSMNESSAANSSHATNETLSGMDSNTAQNNDGNAMISEEEARNIALTHAGLTVDQVTFIKSGIDLDDGRKKYDVEFYTNDHKEYDYEIDPYTGDILDVDFDVEYNTRPSANQADLR